MCNDMHPPVDRKEELDPAKAVEDILLDQLTKDLIDELYVSFTPEEKATLAKFLPVHVRMQKQIADIREEYRIAGKELFDDVANFNLSPGCLFLVAGSGGKFAVLARDTEIKYPVTSKMLERLQAEGF